MEDIRAIQNKSMDSIFSKEDILRTAIIIFGAVLNGCALNSFLAPHKFLAGGVTGIATLLYFATGIPNYVFLWFINIPIFIIAFKCLSFRKAGISLIGFIAYALSLQFSRGLFMPISNPVVSSVIGGLLVGTGTALVFWQGGSLGGLDVVCFYIAKKYRNALREANNFINAGILVILIFIFDFESAALTFISMFFVSKGISYVRDTFKRKKNGSCRFRPLERYFCYST